MYRKDFSMFIKKFDLSIYKITPIYFKLFDVIMKNNSLNKDNFLDSKKITPSSYRRASKSEQKIGENIIKKLSKVFKLKMIDSKGIDELEELLNEIYYDMYYKIYENYDNYLNRIEELLNKNLLIYPILNLFKLFLIANANNSPKDIISQNYCLYEDTISFSSFLENVFSDVVDLVKLSYTQDLTDDLISKKYNLGLHYFVIASKLWISGNNTGSLYYCAKAKDLFVQEENYIRIIYVNLTIMSNYNMICNFSECNQLANKQLLILKNIRNNGIEYQTTLKHLMLSLLGLKQYEDVLSLLENKQTYNITELCYLLISKFKTNKEEYFRYFNNEIDLNELNEKCRLIVKYLNSYLVKREKRALYELENLKIGDVLIKILKKL